MAWLGSVGSLLGLLAGAILAWLTAILLKHEAAG
jgi:hypothetical protein